MKLTMNDIAKATGVSQPTISRILNGSPNVKAEKKIKVLEYIEKVGYRPNLIAKSLKNNSSYLIGLCISDLSNPYFIEIFENLEKVARKNNYSLIVHNSKKNPILEWENIMDFVDRQVDGIVLVPCSNFNLDKVVNTKIPLVILTQIKKGIDSVGVSHISGGIQAAKHLINLGHRNIGYIGGDIEADDKFIGFNMELEKNGIEFNMNNYLCISDYLYTIKERDKVIHDFFEKNIKGKLPSAFFVGNDVIAYETIKILEDFDLKVPEDISIVGFDDTLIAGVLKITSIKQPIEDLTNIAFEILMKKIKTEILVEEVEHIELDPILLKRKTTKKIEIFY
ncbi:MAG: LacI family DNA-binding transcriptional regulator [Fusobacteriaceae bacterium]|nr:LacI family DNA-binding transcriptional regulator [Fusobacteriaceae bacterium]MBN2837743.1 LacI family DNA-binding transcriptional regulator [Fusobacteriaceae bacterium]